MADKFNREERSSIMRRVRSNQNKSTELKLIVFLRENKITGWRRKYKAFGKPDFVFPKLKVAIFVDGCFWHGHSCKTIPANNKEYWVNKISRNKIRDKVVNRTLTSRGWRVIRVWECGLKNERKLMKALQLKLESKAID